MGALPTVSLSEGSEFVVSLGDQQELRLYRAVHFLCCKSAILGSFLAVLIWGAAELHGSGNG
jgi:hypothetical protein